MGSNVHEERVTVCTATKMSCSAHGYVEGFGRREGVSAFVSVPGNEDLGGAGSAVHANTKWKAKNRGGQPEGEQHGVVERTLHNTQGGESFFIFAHMQRH